MNGKVFLCALFGILLGATQRTKASDRHYALLAHALAPNAGGQQAYNLKMSDNKTEWSLFVNTYLTTGSIPLAGASYSYRFPICDYSCWYLPTFIQLGVGGSSGGPLLEITLATLPLSIIRIDITTHLIITQKRIVNWSYPLWVGISLPFSLPGLF